MSNDAVPSRPSRGLAITGSGLMATSRTMSWRNVPRRCGEGREARKVIDAVEQSSTETSSLPFAVDPATARDGRPR